MTMHAGGSGGKEAFCLQTIAYVAPSELQPSGPYLDLTIDDHSP